MFTGFSGKSLRTPGKPEAIRKAYFTQYYLKGIYSKRRNYKLSVGAFNYMHAEKVLPIAVRAFKIPKLVLHGCANCFGEVYNQLGEKKKSFYTDVYTYDNAQDQVYYTRRDGIVEHPDVEVCMLFFDDLVHFEVLRKT